ncbi:phi13 family phage major tail protein [Cytobacillus firmus]|uniref:Phi13 family phage major tail protein n=2 Tax=Cytobacillus TaxID=2675230 RepID=A0A366JPP5_CYTFI|nr:MULTISPECIES: major tail protein [Cytobacillus]RBP89398.1 phi13 family phage major tail protein [Cytobacillus firmus]TDX47375.1 phi13 family phage major tail protein [Cytobacillus oceanisediminis]
MAENKVIFGIKNAHYATFTTDTEGNIIYGTPIPMPGLVELSLEIRGDLIEFYADDNLYFSGQNNQGYDATLSIANIPESFAIDVLGEIKDATDMVSTEVATAKGAPFAFLFEFGGDVKATRYVLYNCTANRPTVTSSTTTDTVEPTPNELTFVSSARSTDYAVKTKTTPDTPAAIYDAWYDAVYEPTLTETAGVEG